MGLAPSINRKMSLVKWIQDLFIITFSHGLGKSKKKLFHSKKGHLSKCTAANGTKDFKIFKLQVSTGSWRSMLSRTPFALSTSHVLSSSQQPRQCQIHSLRIRPQTRQDCKCKACGSSFTEKARPRGREDDGAESKLRGEEKSDQ